MNAADLAVRVSALEPGGYGLWALQGASRGVPVYWRTSIYHHDTGAWSMHIVRGDNQTAVEGRPLADVLWHIGHWVPYEITEVAYISILLQGGT